MTHEEIAALVERLELHPSWRDSHGELNAAPNEAATAIRQLMAENEQLAKMLAWYADQLCEGLCNKDPKACKAIGGDKCGGCPARAALGEQP